MKTDLINQSMLLKASTFEKENGTKSKNITYSFDLRKQEILESFAMRDRMENDSQLSTV